jgi:hypothetical protein
MLLFEIASVSPLMQRTGVLSSIRKRKLEEDGVMGFLSTPLPKTEQKHACFWPTGIPATVKRTSDTKHSVNAKQKGNPRQSVDVVVWYHSFFRKTAGGQAGTVLNRSVHARNGRVVFWQPENREKKARPQEMRRRPKTAPCPSAKE